MISTPSSSYTYYHHIIILLFLSLLPNPTNSADCDTPTILDHIFCHSKSSTKLGHGGVNALKHDYFGTFSSNTFVPLAGTGPDWTFSGNRFKCRDSTNEAQPSSIDTTNYCYKCCVTETNGIKRDGGNLDAADDQIEFISIINDNIDDFVVALEGQVPRDLTYINYAAGKFSNHTIYAQWGGNGANCADSNAISYVAQDGHTSCFLRLGTRDPTLEPTLAPTTKEPSKAPSKNPTGPTPKPTPEPTDSTSSPTPSPTALPTLSPTPSPTDNPTTDPTRSPTTDPTWDPTIDPTTDPTDDPTGDPTTDPTLQPTFSPTPRPTAKPTKRPVTFRIFDGTPRPTTRHPTEAPTKEEKEPVFKLEDVLYVLAAVAGVGIVMIIVGILQFYQEQEKRANNGGIGRDFDGDGRVDADQNLDGFQWQQPTNDEQETVWAIEEDDDDGDVPELTDFINTGNARTNTWTEAQRIQMAEVRRVQASVNNDDFDDGTSDIDNL